MIINSEERRFEREILITELLLEWDLDKEKVVVEVNGEIVAKDKFDSHLLSDRDIIEIVGFVGGG